MTQPPRSEHFDDVYFSADGGPEETLHVFCDGNNLPAAWQDRQSFTIGETGFGTGLNFLLAWELFDRTAPKGAFLDFVSVEKFPLSAAEIEQGLSPWAERLSPYLKKMLAQYPLLVPGFHRVVFDNRVALTLIFGDANDVFPEIDGQVDAWFLDGFTPSKNPDMWTDNLFGQMARLSHDGTTFSTFTAAGFVKRGLRAAGFTVEKKKGFGRKRDMLAGYFSGLSPLSSPASGGRRDGENPPPTDEMGQNKEKLPPTCGGIRGGIVTILGAGLAGTACAYVLRQYGFTPVLHDPNGLASGSSGNPVGIINPRFSAFRNAESDFYTAAFAHMARTLSILENIDYKRCGSLHLVTDEDKQKRFSRTLENWGWHADHMQMVEATGASDLAGIELDQSALWLPDSAQVNPSALCAQYAEGADIIKSAPEKPQGPVIFANGFGAQNYLPELPIHTVRGQIAFVAPSAQSEKLKCNLCYGGYISAPHNGRQVVGSSFQKWLTHTDILEDDTAAILGKLADTIPSLSGDFTITGARASLRTSSQDRFPIAGAVPGQDNQFVSTAHGSHGIASTLASAHLIADLLRGGVLSLGKSSVQALSPQRFIDRAARSRA